MNARKHFIKKVIYLVVISLLLAPLFIVGRPAITDRPNAAPNTARNPNPGGMLSQLRSRYNISESNLGEVNPAGETIQWATFGLKGVAAVMLWTQAMQFQKEEDYDRLSATLNQIVLIQPNYVHVWESQAHNLSYNCSAEFDGYKQRYTWVKKGLEFLFRGVEQNENQPRLLNYTGWFFGQKIGRADESASFRREFGRDDEFHAVVKEKLRARGRADWDKVLGAKRLPDNWLVAKQWQIAAQQVVDGKGLPVRGASPLIFFKDAAMSQINYSARIEEEGILDEYAQSAWREAERDWVDYGKREIPHSTGTTLRLGDREEVEKRLVAAQKAFDELMPGVKEKIKEEKYKKLTESQRKAYDMKPSELDPLRLADRQVAEDRMRISNTEIAASAPPEQAVEARNLMLRLDSLAMNLSRIINYRYQVNYDYWLVRCQSEQSKEALDARQAIFQGEAQLKEGALEKAKTTFEDAFVKWADIYKKYPLLESDITALDLVPAIKNYVKTMAQLDLPISKDFPLRPMLEQQGQTDLLQIIDGKPLPNPSQTNPESSPGGGAQPGPPAKPPG